MTLIDEAEQRFVAVSPYVKISKWDKMKKKLSSLVQRDISCSVYVRDGDDGYVTEFDVCTWIV